MRVIVIRQPEFDVFAVVRIPEGSNKDDTFWRWAVEPDVAALLEPDDLVRSQVKEVEVIELQENATPVRVTEDGHVAMTTPDCNYKVSEALTDWILGRNKGKPQGDAVIVTPQYLKSLIADGTAVKHGDTYYLTTEATSDGGQ